MGKPPSYHHTTSRFLLTLNDLYQWSQKHINGIKFIWGGKDEIDEHGKELNDRFRHAPKVLKTRDNHAFVPGACGLNISRVSGQETDFVSSNVICAETTANTKPAPI